jgi:hypothetical protein
MLRSKKANSSLFRRPLPRAPPATSAHPGGVPRRTHFVPEEILFLTAKFIDVNI